MLTTIQTTHVVTFTADAKDTIPLLEVSGRLRLKEVSDA